MPVLVCIRRFVTSGQRLRCGFWSRERERERERRSLLVGSGSMVNFYCRCQQQVSNTFSWGIPSAPEEVGGVWWAICLPKSLAIATCTHNWSRAVGTRDSALCNQPRTRLLGKQYVHLLPWKSEVGVPYAIHALRMLRCKIAVVVFRPKEFGVLAPSSDALCS